MTLGYSSKKDGSIKSYRIAEIVDSLKSVNLRTDHLINSANTITPEGSLLINYFQYRADVLSKHVEPNLMTRDQARLEFEQLMKTFTPTVHLPFNKQKGDKKHYAYLTGIINMLTEKTLNGIHFDANPRKLVVISKNQKPLRTFSRWYDGVYPSTTDPLAIWEIKEYYGTTTFGSRVADGVYETMLDGKELEELHITEDIDIKHYLFVDDYLTWWQCGKSYLCRIIDMLHEGLVDEVLFGREALTRWPEIISSWPSLPTTLTVDDRERLLQS
jgi:hypothetical protein